MPAQKQGGKTKREITYVLLAALMFPMVLWQSILSVNAGTQNSPIDERHRYSIELKLDFENLSYSGSERVRWFNRGDKPTSLVLSLIHISEPTRLLSISYAVFCLKKKN